MEGCRLLEGDVELEVELEVEVLEVPPPPAEDVELPGTVAALTAPSTATEATAASAAATVRRFMRASALSRARMRRST